MRRFLIVVSVCLLLAAGCFAQTSDPSAPAAKEDIQRFLDAMHSRDMIHKMMDSMSQPMHQMIHQQYEKDKDKLPPDFEEHMTRIMDDMFKNMPWDEMLDSMIPAYQKHLNKGDVDSLVAFYTSPVGQKLVRELPAITAEAMQNMMPIMSKYMDTMNARMQAEIAEMKKNEEKTKESKSN